MLALIGFIYSIVGHDLFTFVKHGEWINGDCNFDTLGGTAL